MKISINDLTSDLKNKINGSGVSEQKVIEVVENNLTGRLSNLQTDNKNNIIEAVNELFQNDKIIIDSIGDVNQLETDAKTIVLAVNELLNRMGGSTSNNKIQYAEGIVDKNIYTHQESVTTIDYNCEFTPSLIFVQLSAREQVFSNIFINNFSDFSIDLTSATIAASADSVPLKGNLKINDDKTFSITITQPCPHVLQLNSAAQSIKVSKWYAIGIGEEGTQSGYITQIEPGHDYNLNTNINSEVEVVDNATYDFINNFYGGVTVEYKQRTRLDYNNGQGMTSIDVIRDGSPILELSSITTTVATVNDDWVSVSKNLTGLMPNDIIRLTIEGGGHNPTIVKQFAITFNIVQNKKG